MEYENIIRKLLLSIESIQHNAKQLQHACVFFAREQFYFVVSGLKIIVHGNPDNNL
jgi:hypothetical protein